MSALELVRLILLCASLTVMVVIVRMPIDRRSWRLTVGVIVMQLVFMATLLWEVAPWWAARLR